MNFKLLSCISLVVLFFTSCGDGKGSIKEYIKNADSASIAFYITKDSTAQIIIRDKASIEKLGGYMEGKGTEPVKCSDTGSIWFYESGKKKLQVDFSINSGCSYFSYMMNDKIYSKLMTEDATEYMNSVLQIASATL
jgi:hypothetical protein